MQLRGGDIHDQRSADVLALLPLQRVSKALRRSLLACHVCTQRGFEVSGLLDSTSRTGGSGHKIVSHRCRACGQGVYNDIGVLKDGVSVAPNTLDDPSWFQPYCHIHVDNTPDWLTIDDGLPQYNGPPESLPPDVAINRS